jgi:CO/xanthine dehydrogenase FAD-binding subunit
VIRAPRTEAALLEGGYDALRKAIEVVREEARPIDDVRSTREYRQAMTSVLLQRAIRAITEG